MTSLLVICGLGPPQSKILDTPILAEIKRNIYTAFYPLILRLELSHNSIESKVYFDFAPALYYFLNKERKRSD